MDKLVVTGGRALSGTVDIGGAKNAAVAIIPATLIADGPCVLENVPSISDVAVLMEIMEELGAEAEEIYAAIGPSIGKCCFETDRDVPDALSAFLGGDTEGLWTVREDGKYLVDLRGANARRLVQLGLRPEHIDISEECTVCSHEKYWSARYTKRHHLKRGSMVAGIVLR